MKNRGRPLKRFQGMTESIGRCVITSCKPGPEFRIPVGSGPGYSARRNEHALPIVAMSSDRLFLSGLLASIARLRFTGITRLKLLPLRKKLLIIERYPVS
jgi:hypothetical protein